jgi:hypothetical protein
MPIEITQGDPIPHLVGLNRGQRDDAKRCFHQLTYAAAFGNAAKSEICVENQIRIDLQGVIPERNGQPKRQNLQAQIGGSSVAHVDVSRSVQNADPLNQNGVVRKIVQAFHESLATGRTYYVTGGIP